MDRGAGLQQKESRRGGGGGIFLSAANFCIAKRHPKCDDIYLACQKIFGLVNIMFSSPKEKKTE